MQKGHAFLKYCQNRTLWDEVKEKHNLGFNNQIWAAVHGEDRLGAGV